MRKTAVAIILFGLLFANVTLLFSGIDLLIDAVGFLLVWNGIVALQKVDPVYGKSSITSMVLVVLAVAQLFFTDAQSTIFMILFLLRIVAEGILCWQVLNGFGKLAVQWSKPRYKTILLIATIFSELLFILAIIFGIYSNFSSPTYIYLHNAGVIPFIAILIWYYVLFSKKEST